MGVGHGTSLMRTLKFRLRLSLPKSQVYPLQDYNTKILIQVHFVGEDTQTRAGSPSWMEVSSHVCLLLYIPLIAHFISGGCHLDQPIYSLEGKALHVVSLPPGLG